MKKETKKLYHNNGNEWYEATYINDKRHGLTILWYSNGNKSFEITFKNSIRHGSNIKFNY